MLVLKFGGTSVGSADTIKNIGKIVKQKHEEGQELFLVCSAVCGVTNQLEQMGKLAQNGNDYSFLLSSVEYNHYAIVRELLPVNEQNLMLIKLKTLFNEIDNLLSGIYNLKEFSRACKDRLLSYGELISVQLVSSYLSHENLPTIITDSRKLILTDSNFGCAVVFNQETQERIENWKSCLNNQIPVITGFIASNDKGETTTLGRGGSDYTAAIFASALKVNEIEIWTDVNGFFTADPKLVKNAFSLSELSYREAMELSYFGAKIIYPPTLIPAIESQIPVRIKNTFNPDHYGTLIHSESQTDGNLIKGISSIENCSLINIEGNGIIGMRGFCSRLFSSLAMAGVNIILITQASSEHSISIAISPDDSEKAYKSIIKEFENELAAGKIELPKIDNRYSILAVVGENMRKTHGLSGKIFSSLGKNGINLVAIAQGSSELNISMVIDQKQLSKALNVVHDSLLLSPVKTLNLLCVGTGIIGHELLNQIAKAKDNLIKNHNLKINVIGICNSRKMIISHNEDGLDLNLWLQQIQNEGDHVDLNKFIDKALQLNLPNLVLVDNTSSTDVVTLYEQLFLQNISVVTCNKLGNSSNYQQYKRFKDLVIKTGANFYYETNVGAGLPILKTLNDLLLSGDELLKIEAVLSGTLSYLFNEYKNEKTFADVLKQAQKLGFTEPDPRNDLNGIDFARKLLILAREVGLPLELEHIEVMSILPQSCIDAPTVTEFYEELIKNESYFATFKNQAANERKKLCFIGSFVNGKIELGLQMVDTSHPFYVLNGSENIISFTTKRYKKNPLVVKGPGAGAGVTASGVFADILRTC